MTLVCAIATQLLHALLLLAAAPLLTGVIRKVKARILGRRGPPIVQPYRDLRRLFRKQPIVAEGASTLFVHAPAAGFAVLFTAALLVPSFTLGMVSAPLSDLLVILGLLALARCIQALAAMDIGTAFGGIGASRDMAFATLAEPAALLVVLIFAWITGNTNLDLVSWQFRDAAPGLRVSLALGLIALLVVALAENARMPADNPSTHLELTMVHEAMLLEYSGRHLALMHAQAMLKLLLWLNLIGGVFFPFGTATPDATPLDWLAGLGAWAAKTLVLALALAFLEASIAKMRVFRVPEFLGAALLLALLGVVFLFVSTGGV